MPPLSVTAAAILLALSSLVWILGPSLARSDEVPKIVVYWCIVLGVAGLGAIFGLWKLKKWGFWLTFIVSVLGILSAALVVAFVPDAALQGAAFVGGVFPIGIIGLVVRPSVRQAFTFQPFREWLGLKGVQHEEGREKTGLDLIQALAAVSVPVMVALLGFWFTWYRIRAD